MKPPALRALCLGGLLVLAAGCKDQPITAYDAPKEKRTPLALPGAGGAAGGAHDAATAPGASGMSMGQLPPGAVPAAPPLTWQTPAGWQEQPGNAVRLGTLTVAHPSGGPAAELAITAFPGDVGGKLANLNRWRGQIELPALPAGTDPESQLAHFDLPFGHFDVVDLLGPRQRILGAFVAHDGRTYFFKLTGEPAHVATLREAFVQFLGSVRLRSAGGSAAASSPPSASAPAATGMAPGTPPPAPALAPTLVPALGTPGTPAAFATAAGETKLTWTAAAHWTAKAPSPMRRGSFGIRGDDGREADFSIIAFDGDAGGLLDNINRWRGQVGLPAFGPNDLIAAAQPLETPAGLRFVVVDLAGPEQRILGAVLAYEGESWFFKLLGPAEVVAAERGAFTAFLRTVRPR